jgi:flagellar export protein FliJ
MAFLFSLESVLRLRRGQQRQQELSVQRASEQLNCVGAELRAINSNLLELASSRSGPQVHAAELQFAREQRRVLEERRKQAQFELTKAFDRHSELVRGLRKIWQQREALEALRKREYDAYLREQGRREQATQDDLFLLRTRNRKPLPG